MFVFRRVTHPKTNGWNVKMMVPKGISPLPRVHFQVNHVGFQRGYRLSSSLRLLGMSFWVSSWHLFGGPFRGVTFGGSGVSIGGVGSLRVLCFSDTLGRLH